MGNIKLSIDWWIVISLIPIMVAGLFTMNSFSSDNVFFDKQVVFISFSLIIIFLLSFFDFRFLRRTDILVALFLFFVFLLLMLFLFGHVAKGAQSWFRISGLSFQPSDPVKLVLILVLAKYFSRRHVEIADVRHIFISGLYAVTPFFLVLVQPDFGSAIIIFLIWLGMSLVSGISKKHLIFITLFAVLAGVFAWNYVFEPYQKARIVNFIDPARDARGGGYNALQSIIAVGSGELFGKGVGYGTQSRLKFLPEYETDFIFAAFAEEWGFLGVLLLLLCFGVIVWRILSSAGAGETNFETLFAVGLSVFLMSHVVINVGMNIGLLPVTGISLPFMSYGGSHLFTEAVGLGILMGMRRYARVVHRDHLSREFLGLG